MSQLQISSVHDALQDAVVDRQKQKREPKENITVRMDPLKKEELKKICQVNGTTASDFLRSCADALLKDYMGPKQFARFEAKAASSE